MVALYYASREIRYRTITELLQHKCNTPLRNDRHITYQVVKQTGLCEKAGLGKMRTTQEQVNPVQPWDRKVVDSWLINNMMEKGKLEGLLVFDGATAAIIERVSTLELRSCFSQANQTVAGKQH